MAWRGGGGGGGTGSRLKTPRREEEEEAAAAAAARARPEDQHTAAYIERLQATSSHLALSAPRPAGTQNSLLLGGSSEGEAGEAGIDVCLIGTVYNFLCCCWQHRSVRLRYYESGESSSSSGGGGGDGDREDPGPQGGGLTDHRWAVYELLSFAVLLRMHPRSGAADADRDGWMEAALMLLDCSSTVECATTTADHSIPNR